MTGKTHTGGAGKERRRDDYADVPERLRRLRELDPQSRPARRARDEVITRCLPLAEHIALRYRGRGEPHEDLVQVARVGLVNAIDRFDSERGRDFVSFAVPTIMGEVRRYFRDAGWSMRVPRRMKELNLQISGATDRLAQRLGRSPSPREIAAELGIPVADVSEGLLARGAYQTDSMDAAVRADGDGLALGDLIGEEDPELEKVEGLAAIRPMLAELSERDRAILMMRFYGSMTQTQIAERVGISQMHVSRILSKTLKRLRAQADTD